MVEMQEHARLVGDLTIYTGACMRKPWKEHACRTEGSTGCPMVCMLPAARMADARWHICPLACQLHMLESMGVGLRTETAFQQLKDLCPYMELSL